MLKGLQSVQGIWNHSLYRKEEPLYLWGMATLLKIFYASANKEGYKRVIGVKGSLSLRWIVFTVVDAILWY